MQMDHFQCLEAAVKDPLDTLSKTIKKNVRGGLTNLHAPVVYAMQEETLHFNGLTHTVHRIFVISDNYPEYKTVGWLLYNDVEHCLICSVAFGFFCYKYYCWACGNIVCNTCSPCNIEVEEIRTLGPKKVCLQCYWGQERVFAVHSYRDPNAIYSSTAESTAVPPASVTGFDSSNKSKFQIKSAGGTLHTENKHGLPSLNGSSTNPNYPSSSAMLPPRVPSQRENDSIISGSQHQNASPVTPNTPTSSSRIPTQGTLITSGPAAGYMVVQPVAGFVIKTWRTDADKSKVFINICCHPAVPYNSEESLPDKDVFKIAGELKRSCDKDGSPSTAVDVVVHPNEIRVCEIDSRSRVRLCNQSIAIIQQLYSIPLDANFKILKLLSNYKGDEISQSFVPKSDAYSSQAQSSCVSLYSKISPVLAQTAQAATSIENVPTTSIGNTSGTNSNKIKSMFGGGNGASIGPTTMKLTPTPGFVMKLKDSGGNKMFINVCYHEAVPVHAPTSALAVISRGRPSCFIFGTLMAMSDGSGQVVCCIINNETYHGLETHIAAHDPHLTKFCSQIIKKWNEDHQPNLDETSITFPKTKHGFKGDGEVLPAMDVIIPSASYSSTAASSTAASSSSSSNAVDGTNPMLLRGVSLSRMTVDSDTSRATLSDGGNVSVAVVNATSLAEANDNPMNLPGSQYLPALTLLTNPIPGFVVGAVKESGQLLYINVCHSPTVGTVCSNFELPRDKVKLVLSGLGVVSFNHLSSTGSKKNIVLDVIIESEYYTNTIINGNSRDEMVISILEFIGTFGVKLADEFTLPVIDGGYLIASVISGSCAIYTTPAASTGNNPSTANSNTYLADIFPLQTFSIFTDCTRKHQQTPVFFGELYKRGHGHKSWKRRQIQFSGRRIKYFEKTVFKGDFDVKGCSIEIPLQAESGAPTPYQFILHSSNTKDASLICCADSDEVRNLWVKVVSIQCRMVTASASCMNCPPVRVGFMKKQGHMIRNWQKRYFVLDMGILRYYEKSAGKGIGENLKGQLGLAGSTVSMQGTDRLYISEGSDGSKDMLLQVDEVSQDGSSSSSGNSMSLCSLWYRDIQEHITFATENQHLVNIQSKE